MNDIDKLKEVVADLRARLRQETQHREELERRCQVLEKLAYRDPNTGLHTETYLHARVREEIERCSRYPATASLVTLCAPEQRSDVLPQLGTRLTQELRESDQVFKLDKNGLAILLVETPEDGARRVLERLAADLQQFINGYGYSVTTFPVDANLAEEFMNLALTRHNEVREQVHVQAFESPAADASFSVQ